MASIFSVSLLLVLVVSSHILSCSSEVSQKELRSKEIRQVITKTQLSRTIHSNRVDPSRVVQLSWRPRVFLYKGLLSDEECEALISLAHKLNETSSTNGEEWRLESSETRKLAGDDMVLRIEERISAWTFLPKENGKALKVLRYGNEDSEEKLTYFGNRSSLEEQEDEINPLIATVILYLSDINRGGQILFPHLEDKGWSDCANSGQISRPTRGSALLFFNSHHNATLDHASTHVRCPVPESEMWCATKLFHVKVRAQEKIRHSSDDSLCSDQDDNCPKWASVGECERNPVFMVGSDDYFGTCRLSCNVC